MIYHILAIGDVVGEQGLAHLSKSLRAVKKLKDVHFTVVNGENAAGTGILPRQVEDLYAAGADVVTLGNHTFRRQQIAGRLEEDPYLLRPANFTGRAPGRGWGVYDCGHIQIGVMNLIGRCGLDFHADNPFIAADRLLRGTRPGSRWWTSTPRPPARSWPWGTTWTAGCPPCGAPTPMCPRRTGRCCPRGPAM